MRTVIISLLVAGLQAQSTKFTDVKIIPTSPDVTGTISWLEKRANGVHKFTWKSPDALAADVTFTWPVDGAAGFLYSDGAGGTSWTGAGTCGVDCMTLTTNQSAAGIKTFTNGIIMQGTSTARALNPEADNTYDFGTTAIRWSNIWGVNLKSRNGEVIVQTSGGVDRAVLGVNGFTGYDITPAVANSIYATGGGFQGFNTTLGYGVNGAYVIDNAAFATLTGATLNTGAAVIGYCWIATSVGGAGDWGACSAGGSYVTTNTNQATLTGTKSWDSAHTYNASILAGTGSPNIGDDAARFSVIHGDFVRTHDLQITDAGFASHWGLSATSGTYLSLVSGSGAQAEAVFQTFGGSDSQVLFRGTLAPLVTPAGNNGDIGFSGTPFRNAYFSSQVNAETGYFSGASPVVTVIRSGTSASIASTSIQGINASAITKVLLNWSGGGGGIVRTYSNIGTEQNSLDGVDGIRTNVGYAVGTSASPIPIIDNTGHATFPALTLPVGAVASYIWTATDGLGNGAWAVNAATGSYVTTNTNQAALAGTKDWDNTHTFNGGVAVKLNSTARNWYPEVDAAYDLGADGSILPRWQAGYFSSAVTVGAASGARSFLGSSNGAFFSGSNVQRITFSNGGGGSSTAGIIRVFNGTAGSEVMQAGMDATGFNTPTGYQISSTYAIDSGRNGNFVNMTVTGTCTGCSSGWTTNTSQTGLSGDKTTSGNLKLTGGASASIEMRASTNDIEVRNGSAALRAYMGTNTGIFSTHTGSAGFETMVIRLTPSGVDLNNFASSGQTTSIVIGACTMNYTYGWLTSKSGC